MATPTRSELARRSRCQRWFKFGTGRRLPRLPRSRYSLARGGAHERLGQYARSGQERGVPAGQLDGVNPELAASRNGAVVARDHAVVGAQDVRGRHRGPLPEGCDLLRNPPVLAAEAFCRALGHVRSAVVEEGLDRALLGPRGAAIGMPNRRLGGLEPGDKVSVLGVEAQ